MRMVSKYLFGPFLALPGIKYLGAHEPMLQLLPFSSLFTRRLISSSKIWLMLHRKLCLTDKTLLKKTSV
jgi:hypothetical protein